MDEHFYTVLCCLSSGFHFLVLSFPLPSHWQGVAQATGMLFHSIPLAILFPPACMILSQPLQTTGLQKSQDPISSLKTEDEVKNKSEAVPNHSSPPQ